MLISYVIYFRLRFEYQAFYAMSFCAESAFTVILLHPQILGMSLWMHNLEVADALIEFVINLVRRLSLVSHFRSAKMVNYNYLKYYLSIMAGYCEWWICGTVS